MDEEQSGNRNSAGMNTAAERTPQSRREKSHGLLEDKEMIPRQIKKGS
jgi:hypothetical protein